MPAPEAQENAYLAGLRDLLADREWPTVLQAVELAISLDEQDCLQPLLEGVSIEEGRVHYSPAWALTNRIRIGNRSNAALLALSLQADQPLKQVRVLDLSDLEDLSDIAPLAQARNLTDLRLPQLNDSSARGVLAGMTELRKLTVADCSALSELPDFSAMPQLEHLALSVCNCSDMRPLAALPHLRVLALRSFEGLSTLVAISGLSRLERLSLTDCPALDDPSGLEGLLQLKRLTLSNSGQGVLRLPLAKLTALEELSLCDLSCACVLNELDQLKALKVLDLSGSSQLYCLFALLGLEALEELTLPDRIDTGPDATQAAFLASLKLLMGSKRQQGHFSDADVKPAVAALALLDALALMPGSDSAFSWIGIRGVLATVLTAGGAALADSVCDQIALHGPRLHVGQRNRLRQLWQTYGQAAWTDNALLKVIVAAPKVGLARVMTVDLSELALSDLSMLAPLEQLREVRLAANSARLELPPALQAAGCQLVYAQASDGTTS
jgi:hypothetical protein